MRTTGPLYPSCMLSLVRAAAHRSKQINHMMKSVIKGTTLEDSLNTQPHRLENCCRDFEDSWSKAMFNFKVTGPQKQVIGWLWRRRWNRTAHISLTRNIDNQLTRENSFTSFDSLLTWETQQLLKSHSQLHRTRRRVFLSDSYFEKLQVLNMLINFVSTRTNFKHWQVEFIK